MGENMTEPAGNKVRLWTRNFIVMMFLNLMIMGAYQLMNAAIPLYVADQVAGNTAAAGLVSGVFTIASLISRPIFGGMVDKKGRRLFLVIGFIGLAVCYGLCALASSNGMLVVLRILQGISFAMASTAGSTVISDVVPKERVMEGIGFYGLSNTMATAIGPGISLFLIDLAGYRADFLAACLASVVGVIGAFAISYSGYVSSDELKRDVRIAETGKQSDNLGILAKVVEVTAIPMAIVMLFTALAQGSISTFLPLFAKERGISGVGLYYTVYAGALFITRPTTGRLSDKIGANKVILPGMVLIIAAFIFLANVRTLTHVVMVAVIYGFGYGSVQPVLNALMVRICPPERRGVGNSTFHLSMDGGYGIGAIIWGLISNAFGTAAIFYGAAISVGIAMILYFVLLYRKAGKQE